MEEEDPRGNIRSREEDIRLDEESVQPLKKPLKKGPGSGKKRSEIHKHFTYDETEEKYHCIHCKIRIPRDKSSSSTGKLNKHYKDFHEKKGNQPKINDAIQSTSKKVFKQADFEKALVNFILMTHQAFLIVESPYFEDLIKSVNPGGNVHIPCATTVRNRIDTFYKEKSQSHFERVKTEAGKLSLITDNWTSPNRYPFMGVVCQYIDKFWKLQTVILDLIILQGSHTGKNLGTTLLTFLEKAGLKENILSFTADNASNCDTMANELETKLQDFVAKDHRIRCFAHVVNLACKSALSSLKLITWNGDDDYGQVEYDEEEDQDGGTGDNPILIKIRQLVKKIRASNTLTEMLRSYQKEEEPNAKPKDLLLDCKTRWNSTFFMIRRAFKLRKVIDYIISKEITLTSLKMVDAEWDLLGKFVVFLKPFHTVTIYVSEAQTPIMSTCCMSYMMLYDHVEAEKDSSPTPQLKDAAVEAWDKLTKYYGNTDAKVFVIATILDPRCKMVWYTLHPLVFTPAVMASYKTMLQNEYDKYKPRPINTTNVVVDAPPPQKKKKYDPAQLFATQMPSANEDNTDELARYLEEPVVSFKSKDTQGEGGVLNWWKKNQEEFPTLCRMAKDYLACCGTGIPVERFFSTGTDLLRPKRRNMVDETVRKCMVLRSWIHFERNQELLESTICEAITDKMLKV